MPIYEYRHLKKPENCNDVFEVIDIKPSEPLEACPKCGLPVERLMSVFSSKENIFADSNLKDKGFTKLVKDDVKGGYRKVV